MAIYQLPGKYKNITAREMAKYQLPLDSNYFFSSLMGLKCSSILFTSLSSLSLTLSRNPFKLHWKISAISFKEVLAEGVSGGM